jgi:hypothetical protein
LKLNRALAGTTWLSKEELESRLLEKISDKQYSEWETCMERLSAHPKRDKELEFIKSYRKPLAKQAVKDEVPPVTLEPDGRKSCYVGCEFDEMKDVYICFVSKTGR